MSRRGILFRLRRGLRWFVRIVLVLLVLDLVYLAAIWPDWSALAKGPVPKSNFIQAYEAKQPERGSARLAWEPVALARMPRHVIRAVIVAEDSRFYTHSGFDLIAIKEALGYNLGRRDAWIGASTISQQTVKNLYLSSSRNPLRKWHELVLTWGLEHNLRKSRILELYLNIAEFGYGVYGVQAAAKRFYGLDVEQLTLVQAAELAAALPSPRKDSPLTRSERFQKRTQRILEWLAAEQTASRPANDPSALH
jgi:monofunctional biosynthetic peptidoglycan transglycosylase